jgi:hypothetical protein
MVSEDWSSFRRFRFARSAMYNRLRLMRNARMIQIENPLRFTRNSMKIFISRLHACGGPTVRKARRFGEIDPHTPNHEPGFGSAVCDRRC